MLDFSRVNQIFFSGTKFAATMAENYAGTQFSSELYYSHVTLYNNLASAGGDNVQFVANVYEKLLNRINPLTNDKDGVSYWAGFLNSGALNKEQVIDAILAAALANGDRAAATISNAAYVDEIYESVLNRFPGEDAQGREFWTNALNSGAIARSELINHINQIAAANNDAGFFASNTAFLNDLHIRLFNRPIDEASMLSWTNMLNSGADRANVVVSWLNGAKTSADANALASKTAALNEFSTHFYDYDKALSPSLLEHKDASK